MTEPLLSINLDTEQACELLKDFELHFSVIEGAVEELKVIPSEHLLQRVYREIHTMKSNAAIYQLNTLVDTTQAIEDVVSAMREGHLSTERSICDIIMASLDRLRDLHQHQLGTASFANLNCQTIIDNLSKLAQARGTKDIRLAVQQAIQTLTNSATEDTESLMLAAPLEALPVEAQNTIAFFADIGGQIDAQSPHWQERSKLQNYWGLKINDMAERPIKPEQLSAAIFLHDLGMPFLPAELTLKAGKLTPAELNELQQHTQWGHELVRRMTGYEEAATMVLQHHERIDGQGYPAALNEHEICEGAKLIAILDAFFAMISTRAYRKHRRSVMRAISEINACSGTQFCSKWVRYFNAVMRDEVKNGTLRREP